ncbi:DNA-binding protein [Sutcliffiella halmapala]
MDISFFWIGIGLAALGYFIGDGLKNFKNQKNAPSYPTLIKKSDLHLYLNLTKNEVEDLLSKHPHAPKIELNGTTYFPYQQFMEWLASNEIYKS